MDRETSAYKIRRKIQIIGYYLIPKVFLSKVYYRLVCGEKLNLKKPKTFNEKIQWLKLYYLADNPKIIKGADKYKVREYVKEKGLEKILTKHYGVWDDAKKINWNKLPNSFILKCNHGCAYNILVPDKLNSDTKKITLKLNKWLKEDFGKFNVEPHYSKIKKHVIFCEEYLGDVIDDCKFFCFNGKPMFFYVGRGMIDDRNCQVGFFDMEGKKIPVQRDDYKDLDEFELPFFFNDMKKSAEILAKDFSFVRVDFFMANNTYYFAELTFAPSAGMMPINPKKYDYEWGKMLDIRAIFRER